MQSWLCFNPTKRQNQKLGDNQSTFKNLKRIIIKQTAVDAMCWFWTLNPKNLWHFEKTLKPMYTKEALSNYVTFVTTTININCVKISKNIKSRYSLLHKIWRNAIIVCRLWNINLTMCIKIDWKIFRKLIKKSRTYVLESS